MSEATEMQKRTIPAGRGTADMRNISMQIIPVCAMNKIIFLISVIGMAAASFPATAEQTLGFYPANPAASGYALVFSDDFSAANTIDLKDTGAPGYNWYLRQFFGDKTTPAETVSMANGFLTLTANGNLNTAAPATNAQGWVGQVFGGGAYFEASIRFDPKTVNEKNGSWPAFWSMAIEHFAVKGASQWPGQPAGYEHFIEDDFFEDDTASWAGADTYGGAMHDWHGKWKETCPAYCNIGNSGDASGLNNFVIHLPPSTDWTQFHAFGQLWVAGNSSNGNRGFVQYYFDGQPTTDKVTWLNAPSPGVPPPSGTAIFSIIDKQHLALVLGTGVSKPMSVKWVRVWQLPGQGTVLTQAPPGKDGL